MKRELISTDYLLACMTRRIRKLGGESYINFKFTAVLPLKDTDDEECNWSEQCWGRWSVDDCSKVVSDKDLPARVIDWARARYNVDQCK